MLAQAHQLVELNLSANALTVVEGLTGLSRLEVLDLASNRLREVAGLDGLRVLRKMNLAHNRLASLAGLAALQVPCGLVVEGPPWLCDSDKNDLRKVPGVDGLHRAQASPRKPPGCYGAP